MINLVHLLLILHGLIRLFRIRHIGLRVLIGSLTSLRRMVSPVDRFELEVIVRVNTTSILLLFAIEVILAFTCIRILLLLAPDV